MQKVIPFLAFLSFSLTATSFAKPNTSEARNIVNPPTEIQKLRQQLKVAQAEQAKSRQAAQALGKELTQLKAAQAKHAKEEANKQMVLTFYQQFFGDKDITAADRYILPGYIQHNPFAATGRDALKAFFMPFFANPDIPKTKIDVRRVAAEGDLVWLHIRSKTTGSERAVVDIFRIENGKIAEHWDVVQPVPEKSANNNTMF